MEYKELIVFFIDNYQLKYKKIKITKKQYNELLENPSGFEIEMPPLIHEKQEKPSIVNLCKYWIEALTIRYYDEFEHMYIIYNHWKEKAILSHFIQIALENQDIIMSPTNLIINDKIKKEE